MFFIFYLLIFLFGTAIGSFLGVVCDRIMNGESILKGRSHCDHCRRKLGPIDLIPVFSFLLLGRKCRYCHKPLSWFYLVIELVTGIIFLLATFTVFQLSQTLVTDIDYYFLAIYYLVLLSTMIAIFFIDLRNGIIPFKLVGFATAFTLFWYLLLPSLYFSPLEKQLFGLDSSFITVALSALGAAAFFFLLFYFTKGRGMGFGDVVYAFLMGLTLGWPRILLGLYIAFLSGAVISLLLILFKKKKLKGGTIPFGPFLVCGNILSLLWGTNLVTWALHWLGF
jgi:leader peptidase (prepilin peptidase)/N-methyltransferase